MQLKTVNLIWEDDKGRQTYEYFRIGDKTDDRKKTLIAMHTHDKLIPDPSVERPGEKEPVLEDNGRGS